MTKEQNLRRFEQRRSRRKELQAAKFAIHLVCPFGGPDTHIWGSRWLNGSNRSVKEAKKIIEDNEMHLNLLSESLEKPTLREHWKAVSQSCILAAETIILAEYNPDERYFMYIPRALSKARETEEKMRSALILYEKSKDREPDLEEIECYILLCKLASGMKINWDFLIPLKPRENEEISRKEQEWITRPQ